MGRIITVVVLLSVIVAISITGYVVVDGLEKSVGTLLEQADEAASRGDIQGAYEFSAKAEKEFVKREDLVSVFIYHELVEELGVQIAELPDFANEDSLEEFLSALKGAKVMLGHVVSDEKPSLKNVL